MTAQVEGRSTQAPTYRRPARSHGTRRGLRPGGASRCRAGDDSAGPEGSRATGAPATGPRWGGAREERPLSPFDGMTPEHLPAHIDLAEQVVARLPHAATIVTGLLGDQLGRGRVSQPTAGTHAGLTVVTTSLDVAVVLSRLDTMHVYNVGGIVEHARTGAQQGDWTLRTEIDRFRDGSSPVVSPSGNVPPRRASSRASTDGGRRSTTAAIESTQQVWLLMEGHHVGRAGAGPGREHRRGQSRVRRRLVDGCTGRGLSRSRDPVAWVQSRRPTADGRTTAGSPRHRRPVHRCKNSPEPRGPGPAKGLESLQGRPPKWSTLKCCCPATS